ncbi:MAG: hypothetical protein Q7T96_14745 [Methylobacter sp.]|nr:hypothetical protein [Methylobacter sp.]
MLPRPQGFSHDSKIAAASKRLGRGYKPRPAWRSMQGQLPGSGSVSGKYLPNSPETPPRATRLDGLIPAYDYEFKQ